MLGTLVVPKWRSAPYWVKLVDGSGDFVSCIAEVEILPFQNVVQKGETTGYLANNVKFE